MEELNTLMQNLLGKPIYVLDPISGAIEKGIIVYVENDVQYEMVFLYLSHEDDNKNTIYEEKLGRFIWRIIEADSKYIIDEDDIPDEYELMKHM